MSHREKRLLAQSLASCLITGHVNSFQALCLDAPADVILKSIILFRASRASVR